MRLKQVLWPVGWLTRICLERTPKLKAQIGLCRRRIFNESFVRRVCFYRLFVSSSVVKHAVVDLSDTRPATSSNFVQENAFYRKIS